MILPLFYMLQVNGLESSLKSTLGTRQKELSRNSICASSADLPNIPLTEYRLECIIQ